MSKRIFWNVDTQNDFMKEDGKLYVAGAEGIEDNLAALTAYAKEHGIQVVNTADWHREGDKEISDEPDFVETYPEHCVADTMGAEFITATKPEDPYVVDWHKNFNDYNCVLNKRNIVLRKNKFDVFEGNKHANGIVDLLDPKEAIVYGVATNVCVDKAVLGLRERGVEVYVVQDAIKHLPHLDEIDHPLYQGLEGTLANWKDKGVQLIKTAELLQGYK